jgi:hypothetical protein
LLSLSSGITYPENISQHRPGSESKNEAKRGESKAKSEGESKQHKSESKNEKIGGNEEKRASPRCFDAVGPVALVTLPTTATMSTAPYLTAMEPRDPREGRSSSPLHGRSFRHDATE